MCKHVIDIVLLLSVFVGLAYFPEFFQLATYLKVNLWALYRK